MADALFGRRPATRREAGAIATLVVALVIVAASVLVAAVPIAQSYTAGLDQSWNRDFVQEYLVARAVLDDQDPYLPLVTLAGKYLPAAVAKSLPNPTPHPPTLIPLIRFLGLLPYETAGLVWLAVQLSAAAALALVIAVWTRGYRAGGRPLWRDALLGVLLVIAWPPVMIDMYQGQLGLVLTAMFVGGWYAASRGHDRLAGILFGLAVCVKLVPGLLLLHFLLRRRFRLIGWSVGTFLVAVLAALVDVGFQPFVTYTVVALPQTSELWLGSYWNNSVFGAFARALGFSARLVPFAHAEMLVFPLGLAVGAIICLAAAVCGLRASRRPLLEDTGVEFAIWVVAMLLVSPVVWYHYFVSLIFPLAVLGRLMARRNWRDAGMTLLAGAVAITAALPGVAVLLRILFPWLETSTSEVVSVLAYVWSLVPMAGLLVLLGLLVREHFRLVPLPVRDLVDVEASPKWYSLARRSAE